MNKILIVGRTPIHSGIGGVTIHVKRLLELYDKNNVKYDFLDLGKRLNLFKVIKYWSECKTIYSHSSNPYLRFLVGLFCFLSLKNYLLIIHGNLGRFNWIKNKLDSMAIRLSTKPILINDESFQKALRLNSKAILVSSYIPPLNTVPLDKEIVNQIEKVKLASKLIVVTNAFDITFDKFGNEIYGISELIDFFKDQKEVFLVVGDPKGNYQQFISHNFPDLKNQAYFITKRFDFYELLKISDVFIRNTTTDGDSLSIREALELNVTCYATNVVKRPKGTIIFDSLKEVDIKRNITARSDKLHIDKYFEEQMKIITI